MDSPYSQDAHEVNVHGDHCVLTYAKLDASSVLDEVSSPEAGAIASFIGQTRNNFKGKRPLNAWDTTK